MHKVTGFFHSDVVFSAESGDSTFSTLKLPRNRRNWWATLQSKFLPLSLYQPPPPLRFSPGHHHGFQPLEQRNLSPLHVKSTGEGCWVWGPREPTLVKQGGRRWCSDEQGLWIEKWLPRADLALDTGSCCTVKGEEGGPGTWIQPGKTPRRCEISERCIQRPPRAWRRRTIILCAEALHIGGLGKYTKEEGLSYSNLGESGLKWVYAE